MKSVPGTASFALHTVASNIVLPIVSITAPSACFASLPVSRVIVRPSARVMVFVTTFIKFTIYFFNTQNSVQSYKK